MSTGMDKIKTPADPAGVLKLYWWLIFYSVQKDKVPAH